jgi:hypothetical protein
LLVGVNDDVVNETDLAGDFVGANAVVATGATAAEVVMQHCLAAILAIAHVLNTPSIF